MTLDLKRRAVQRAPIQTGDLRGSADTRVKDNSGQVEGLVGFSSEYAIEQHENLTYNHPRGGEAKFLERPYLENRERYKEYVRRVLAGEL